MSGTSLSRTTTATPIVDEDQELAAAPVAEGPEPENVGGVQDQRA